MSNVDEYAVQSSGNRVEYILGVFSPKVRRLKRDVIKFFSKERLAANFVEFLAPFVDNFVEFLAPFVDKLLNK